MVWAVSGDAPVADVNEFAVLGCMADKADHDGCGTWQSKETIAARTHVSEETVKRCWRNMLKRGLITKGDQNLVKHYRADRRPVVYDLMIPYTWFSNVDRINAERERLGRPPITPENRPPLDPAPSKPARADKGKPRPKAAKKRGNSETPREETPEVVHGGTTSRPRGNCKSSAGELVDPQTVTSNPNRNRDTIPPSVSNPQILDANDTDGRTDGGGVIEVQEQEADGAGGSSVAVVPVVMTPGVNVLRAIAAEAPEWRINHAKTLEDQGTTVTKMLAVGFTPQEIRHAIVSVPLPQPVRTTVGAVIGGRLANLRAAGPSAGILLIPAQHTGYDDVYGVRTEDTVHIPPSWREQQARLDADVAGQGRHRLCAGDDGMCGQLAVAGADLCGVCLGGEQPTCQSGCGRGVVAPGALCLVCRDAPSDVQEVSDTCPGLNEHCGRPLQTMGTTGLCGRCTMKAEQIKMDAAAAWQTSVAAAAEAASTPAPF